MVEWRSLWRLVEGVDGGTTTYSFISLEDSDERYAHRIAAEAPVAQVAQVYYSTKERCEGMSLAEFTEFANQWERQRAAIEANDADKADAFFQAISDVRRNLARMEVSVEETVNHYLYDEQEKP